MTFGEELDLRVCFDCLYVDANGLDENILSWDGFLPEYESGWVFGRASHGDVDDELEGCEGHFSWEPCDTCGSDLGGDRFCVKAVRR